MSSTTSSLRPVYLRVNYTSVLIGLGVCDGRRRRRGGGGLSDGWRFGLGWLVFMAVTSLCVNGSLTFSEKYVEGRKDINSAAGALIYFQLEKHDVQLITVWSSLCVSVSSLQPFHDVEKVSFTFKMQTSVHLPDEACNWVLQSYDVFSLEWRKL